MPRPGLTAPPVRFGVFELDVPARELRKHGIKVRLSDQPFQVLELFLERRGEIVTRQELQQRLWSTDTFVDFDLSLNSVIRKLREALGDSAEQPRFIETVPRHGYRFVAPVEPAPIEDELAPIGEPRTQMDVTRSRVVRALTGLLVMTAAALVVALTLRPASNATFPRLGAIAVLPLNNMTGEPARDELMRGMTEGFIEELALVGSVPVISGNSSMRYQGTTKSPSQIARELNVDALVQGSVEQAGDSVRLRVALLNPLADRPWWTQTFEGGPREVVALQAQAARAIATALHELGASGTLLPPHRAPEVNPEAYDLFLRGVAAATQVSHEGNLAAASFFEQAILRQPDFARAHGKLALARLQHLFAGPMYPNDVLPMVEEAAQTALALDETLVEAHWALVMTRLVAGDYARADADIRRVRDLVPTDVSIALEAMVLLRAGRFEEALPAAERALTLDPLSVNQKLLVARANRATGRGTRAIAELQDAVKMEPRRPDVLFQLGVTYLLEGDTAVATTAFEGAVALSTVRNPRFRAYLGHAYASAGRAAEARAILEELLALRQAQYVSAFGIALIHDALGDRAATLSELERASSENAIEFTRLDLYPPFRTLVSEPSYRELMRETPVTR